MEPTRDARSGQWLRPLIGPSWQDVHIVVPRGFEAYARVFHPIIHNRLTDTTSWHGQRHAGDPSRPA